MSRFTINGDVGDVFIRITKDRDVQLIFGEDDDFNASNVALTIL